MYIGCILQLSFVPCTSTFPSCNLSTLVPGCGCTQLNKLKSNFLGCVCHHIRGSGTHGCSMTPLARAHPFILAFTCTKPTTTVSYGLVFFGNSILFFGVLEPPFLATTAAASSCRMSSATALFKNFIASNLFFNSRSTHLDKML